MIIFVGILATAGQAIIAKIANIPNDSDAIWQLVAFVIVCAVVFLCRCVRGSFGKKSSRAVCEADQGKKDVRRSVVRHSHPYFGQRRYASDLRVLHSFLPSDDFRFVLAERRIL